MRKDHCFGKLIVDEGVLNKSDWFHYTEKKVVHEVDTMYYTVYVDQDWMEDDGPKILKGQLEIYRNLAQATFEPVAVDRFGTEYVMNGIGFAKIYGYDVEKKDCYTIFFAKGKPGPDVPPIVVQIRSQYLWLNGVVKAFDKSLKDITRILKMVGVTVRKVNINRMDYANHTNSIQNLMRQFNEKHLKAIQISNFTRARKEYDLEGPEDTPSCDYFSMGRRTSKNLFFRAYDKTAEVCNKGYKQFFLKLWVLEGLISRYDFYCLERCFLQGSYGYLDKARLEFYLEYGVDEKIKFRISELLAKNTETSAIHSLANELTPRVTKIMNLEFQCMRKFFCSIQWYNDGHPYNMVTMDVYRILRHHSIIHKYLTTHILRFVPVHGDYSRKRDKPTADWWARIQSVTIGITYSAKQTEIFRTYQKDLDIKALDRRLQNTLIVRGLYKDLDNENTVEQDAVDYLFERNESEVQDTLDYKKRKATQLRSRLNGLQEKSNAVVEIDSLSGEITEILQIV